MRELDNKYESEHIRVPGVNGKERRLEQGTRESQREGLKAICDITKADILKFTY